MGDYNSTWSSISGFFGDLYKKGKGYYDEFMLGYEYGDEEPGTGSFIYRAGDYVEDVFDLGSKAGKVKGFIDKTTGPKSFTAPSVSGSLVDASRYGEPSKGNYQARQVDYAKIGYADPRVQSAAAKIARTELDAFKSTQRALGMTTRGGRYTMGLQANMPVKVGTKTPLPKISEKLVS